MPSLSYILAMVTSKIQERNLTLLFFTGAYSFYRNFDRISSDEWLFL